MLALLLFTSLFQSGELRAQSTVNGYWKTAIGAIVQTYPCVDLICIRIVRLSPSRTNPSDYKNGDPAMRIRPLCGLQIGSGFRQEPSGKYDGGNLYDPDSGRSYNGSLAVEGDSLKLRASVLFLGVTQVWSRLPAETYANCR